ncbi:MAG: AsmA family protein, partial [Pseudomonadales bacterium]
MKKLVKIFAGLIATIAVLLVAGGVILGLFIDPNDYKAQIRQTALDQAGIELSIKGDIGWSVFPWVGLKIADIEATYPGRPTLAKLSAAQVSVKVAPLFSGAVEMQTITVAGLDLNLQKAADGTTNWEAASAASQDESGAQGSDSPADSQPSGSALKIDIQSIILSDAKVRYSDIPGNSSAEINALNLTTGRVVLGQPFSAELSFNALTRQGQKQILSASVDIGANFDLNLAAQHYQIKQLDGKFTVTTDKRIELTLAADLSADLAAQKVRIDNLSLAAAGAQVSGQLALEHFTNPKLDGALQVASFDLKALMNELGLAPIVTGDDSALRNISLQTKLAGNLAQLDLQGLVINVDDTVIAGSASYALLTGRAAFNLKGDVIDLNRYLPPKAAASANSSSANSGTSNAAGGASSSGGAY